MDTSTTPIPSTNGTADHSLEGPATWSVAVIVVSFFGVALVALGLYIRNRQWASQDMQETLIDVVTSDDKTGPPTVKVAWAEEVNEITKKESVQQIADNR